MTLDQLRVFVAVAERCHVTRAAEALHMAQSAVSAAVATLEGRGGTKLFHRIGRSIALTEAGTLFLAEARAVLARSEAAERVLADLGGLKRGTLNVRASQTIASYWLPRHLVAFRRAYPGIDVRLKVGNTAEVAAAVHDGAADLGFVEGAIDDPALEAVEVARDQLVIVVAPGHPWAAGQPVRPEAWPESDWVLREPGSGTRSIFEAAARAAGVLDRLPVAFELPSNEAVRGAVEAGAGATALSASVAAPSIEAGLLEPVASGLPERAFTLLRHKDHHRSKAEEAFLAVILGASPTQGRS
ncbi:LysR substrate-binding domain-containing protein [Lichenihabitans sp. Uapishka_5]|uniref:LysR family transcriptional regulator n=1 Tax=Lichenihabitans sp. Uapishka_5 TaxID=3037302 RepID=UPI0029E80BD9|nr:LysR substrate-binding domain-containing protein [Lichenihabitans sp. Uapishka_5]MDX7952362.1 LysR substrate-binding domain-containing protein [Lichenihabitans sp. Uapishka_5]